MAIILNTSTGEQISLLTQHIFGRHPATSHTLLINPDTSRMHASIFWDGEHWILLDSSTNGSFINGKHISRGHKIALAAADKIHFGNPNGDAWLIVNVDAPKSILVPETPGLSTIELESLAVLPSEESPEITLYISPMGHWICESEAGISVLKNGDRVGTNQNTWRFVEANPTTETVQLDKKPEFDTSSLAMNFEVSQNEEHVSLQVKMDDKTFDLGLRNHHYLILLLARQRLSDKAAGLSEKEQGWIDKELLSKMLGQNESHINIQVYRFRKQMVNALPTSLVLPQIIERRTREIRIAYQTITINGGSAQEQPTPQKTPAAI